MCTNGLNTNQLRDSLQHIEDTIALTRRWTHKLYHQADDARMQRTAQQLIQAQRLLDDLRGILDETAEAIERDDEDITQVSVTRA